MNGRNFLWTLLGIGAAVGAAAYMNRDLRKQLTKTAGNAGARVKEGYEEVMHQIAPGNGKATQKSGKRRKRKTRS